MAVTHDPIRRERSSYLWLISLVALVVAMAWPVQNDGWTQSAHYALVRSLAEGTPRIDEYVPETGDISYWDGHYYSTKAPGLAVLALPLYVPLERAGLWPDHRRVEIWLLSIWTTTLAALLLLVVVRRVAESFDPGTGTVAAIALGATTMMLPFAAVFFHHVLAALLAFACFWVLIDARGAPPSPRRIAAAGALAGAAVCVEYQAALAALALAVFATATSRPVVRGLSFVIGFVAALAPLALYNTWAFGNPLHLSYVNAVIERGSTGHDVVGGHSHGVLGVTAPSLHVVRDLLLADRGLLITTPIVAAAVAGVVLLYRHGRRAEALTIGGVFALYLLFNAGITTTFGGPYGGNGPAPRYLLPALPFVFAPFGLVYRRAPGVVLALGAVSLATIATATATRPFIEGGQTGDWWHRLGTGEFIATATVLLGSPEKSGWAGITPFFAALAVAVAVCTVVAFSARRPTRTDAVTATVTFVIWLLLVRVVAALRDGGSLVAPLALAALAAILVVGVAYATPRVMRESPAA